MRICGTRKELQGIWKTLEIDSRICGGSLGIHKTANGFAKGFVRIHGDIHMWTALFYE